MDRGARLTVGWIWALVACPLLGWTAAWYANMHLRGLGLAAGVFFLGALPALLAAGGTAAVGDTVRPRWAGLGAALVSGSLFLALVVWLVVTMPFS